MICCFGDAISGAQAKLLHTLGPNQGLAFASDDDSPDVADLLGRVVFFYSARAAHNCVCPNLHAPTRYEAHVTAEPHCTQDIKDVINCIGGIQVIVVNRDSKACFSVPFWDFSVTFSFSPFFML